MLGVVAKGGRESEIKGCEKRGGGFLKLERGEGGEPSED